MQSLRNSFGDILSSVIFVLILLWGGLLIVGPQLSVLEEAMVRPERQLDSYIISNLASDADTCQLILNRIIDENKKNTSSIQSGGLASPSFGNMSSSSSSMNMAVPSFGNTSNNSQNNNKRPFIVQCERSRTDFPLTGESKETLASRYNLPILYVDEKTTLVEQLKTAENISELARTSVDKVVAIEKATNTYNLENFKQLFKYSPIPMTEEVKDAENIKIKNQLLNILNIRYENEGVIYQQITITILVTTILYAILATFLSLIICYPIAYKMALMSRPKMMAWLFVALLTPYSIAELMRIYAWVSILENNGLINQILDWIGFIDINAQEYIPFKRYPMTVFLVIVYTYMLFMVFPIYNVMSTLDRNQIDAARDLGASMLKVHKRVIIPHSKPGIAVGCIATFMLSAGAFSVPRIISRGLQSEWFTQTIYNKFFESQNSNLGSAYAIFFTITCFVIVGMFMWLMQARLKDFMRV